MVTKLAPLFSKGTDDWATPDRLFATLDGEFRFTRDAAATHDNRKVNRYFGPDHPCSYYHDALTIPWGDPLYQAESVWLNPPYSRCREFIAKAADEARAGRATVVCLVPARTDTRWFHDHVYHDAWFRPRLGVEMRFLKGRIKFGEAMNGAPFPSMVVVFRCWPQSAATAD